MRREAPLLAEVGRVSGGDGAHGGHLQRQGNGTEAPAPDPFESPEESEIDSIVDSEDGSKDGAEEEQHEAEKAVRPTSQEFWLEYGCRSQVARLLVIPTDDEAKFASSGDKIGKVQCCSNGATPHCVRKDEENCFSGDNDSTLMTYSEAFTTCEANDLRLCTKEELLSERSLGCCSEDCSLNDRLVWTSTDRVLNAAEEHDILKTTLKEVTQENDKLEEDNNDLAYRVATIARKINAELNGTAVGSLNSSNNLSNNFSMLPLAPLPGQIDGMTDEQADKMRAENKKLAKEREELEQETRKNKNIIIEMVNSSMKKGEIDPLTYPKQPMWPIPGKPGDPVVAECDDCETQKSACDDCEVPHEGSPYNNWHNPVLRTVIDSDGTKPNEKAES